MTNQFDPELKKQNARRKAWRKEQQRIEEGQRRYEEWKRLNKHKTGVSIIKLKTNTTHAKD